MMMITAIERCNDHLFIAKTMRVTVIIISNYLVLKLHGPLPSEQPVELA